MNQEEKAKRPRHREGPPRKGEQRKKDVLPATKPATRPPAQSEIDQQRADWEGMGNPASGR
jgi:hypothetical protein